MNKHHDSSQIGIKLIAWIMSDKRDFNNDISSFAEDYSTTVAELESLIQQHGIERNLFEKIGVPSEKIDWIMVGTKIALLSNIAFQKYEDNGRNFMLQAEEQCFKALTKVGISFDKREKFSALAKNLQNDISLDEKNFLLTKLNSLIEEIANEKFQNMKTKILFFNSNPLNESRLKVDKEVREIEEGIKRANKRDSFEFKVKLATRPKDFSRAVLEESPNILHFSGHGAYEGIAFEDDQGNSNLVTTERISELFSLFNEEISCVVLNSCYSENQAKSIGKHIQYVVGMKKAIPDETAIEFAISFYDALGAGRTVEFAFSYAVKDLIFKNISGSEIPILLTKNS